MADKNIFCDIPPNYVTLAMRKEKWIKEQERKKNLYQKTERKKNGKEEEDQLQQTNIKEPEPEPETETLAQAEESAVVELAIKAAKKKQKGKNCAKRGEKTKEEGNVEEKLEGGDSHAPMISALKNIPAAKPSEIEPKREIVPEQRDRGGESVKPNHDEREEGLGFRWVEKKVMPSEITPKREIVPERSDRVEDVAQKIGRLSVNDYGKGRLRRPTGEHRGSRGYRKRTNVQTIWARKGEATRGAGVDGISKDPKNFTA